MDVLLQEGDKLSAEADLEIFEGGGGLQPLMTTFVHHSVRKGGLQP